MKKSLSYLPEEKQHDLRQLVGIIREEVRECEMIILYGSYARNDYVDYDQRVEFGVPTYYMSDYDILIVTGNAIPVTVEGYIFSKIQQRFYQNKKKFFHTHPQLINESISCLNNQIGKGRYFYTDLKKEGVMLYDSGKYKLARRRKLDFAEIHEMAQEYFQEKFESANEFLESVTYFEKKAQYKKGSFMLHQATENYFRTIMLVFTLYGHKEHDLEALMGYCKKHALDVVTVFPRETEEDKRLFQLLRDAYIQARYNARFVVTKEDIDALVPKVERLRDLTERVCREQLAYYRKMAE